MPERTARHGIALMVAGQGQKDVTHNEALLVIDALLNGVIERRDLAQPPSIPVAGQAWLVADAATGAWFGRSGQLAIWTEGGWRFAPVPEGTALHVLNEAVTVRRATASWEIQAPRGAPLPAVALTAGGAVVDAEARTAIATVISRLQQLGLLAG